MDVLIQLVSAFLGSMGFALFFNVRGSKILPASLGGLLTWCVYLLLGFLTQGDVLRYLLSSVVLTFYAEYMAQRMKSPATVFLVCAAVPLIPGGMLYNTMGHAVAGDWEAFLGGTFSTLMLAMAIAGGMLFGMTIFLIVKKHILQKH